jgi:hypothetical protein
MSTAAPSSSIDEQLLALLSSPHHHHDAFDVSLYLNKALEKVEDADVPTRLAELALQLQFQTAQSHDAIGQLGAELRAILPRAQADTGRLAVGLSGLQQDAGTLSQASQRALWGSDEADDKETPTAAAVPTNHPAAASSSLETLSTLHALQANLSRTRDILTAAATWDETLASMPPLLATPNQLPQAVSQLAVLKKGEQALRGMPHGDQRRAALAKVRTQVSALLQPQLAHALQTMQSRLGPLQQCVSLYSQLDLLPQLEHEYVQHRPAALHKLWFDYQPPATTLESKTVPPAVGMASNNRPALADWLPTWFQAVLQVLQEERRQTATVFGPAAVPRLQLAVLRQALKPLLGSLTSRLTQQGLPQVARVYQACLQFLSLAYDGMSAVYLDYMEAGGSTPADTTNANYKAVVDVSGTTVEEEPNAWQLWQDFLVIVTKVLGQPLQSFQVQWASLEESQQGQPKILQTRQELSALLATARSGGLDQGTVDQVWHWLTEPLSDDDGDKAESSIRQIVQQAIGRFALFRGGYGAPEAVYLVDELLSQYIHVVVQALQQWSEACQSQTYEDAHVLSALSVLRIAGWVQQQIDQLQQETRQELKVLEGRIVNHVQLLEGLPSNPLAASKFVLPDSLSTVAINAMLTLSACGSLSNLSNLETAQMGVTTLERLSGEKMLLPKSQQAATALGQICHAFVFDVCFTVPRLHLASLSGLSPWKESTSVADPLASYGTPPQSYITQVGEHMLSLVQALEPFAADAQSLALVQPVMVNLRHVSMQPWKELLRASGVEELADETKLLTRLMDGKDLLDLVVGSPLMEEEEGEPEDDESRAVNTFCNSWLDVTGLAVTGRLLERVLRIPTLTAKGCEHLQVDLNYLVNVLTALGVQGHPHPLLGHMAELAVLDGTILRERIKGHDTREPLESCLSAMEQRLAAMRGIH